MTIFHEGGIRSRILSSDNIELGYVYRDWSLDSALFFPRMKMMLLAKSYREQEGAGVSM